MCTQRHGRQAWVGTWGTSAGLVQGNPCVASAASFIPNRCQFPLAMLLLRAPVSCLLPASAAMQNPSRQTLFASREDPNFNTPCSRDLQSNALEWAECNRVMLVSSVHARKPVREPPTQPPPQQRLPAAANLQHAGRCRHCPAPPAPWHPLLAPLRLRSPRGRCQNMKCRLPGFWSCRMGVPEQQMGSCWCRQHWGDSQWA